MFTVISELVVANESRARASIVILAERDKVEMEDAICDRADDAGQAYGVRINPRKSETFAPAAGDRLIVLAVD